ncbi:hypothetical protein F5884DRAFT_857066 [Xylogone sp. PMI_703]|nr:hypothetical protein F5884DRAFT_857066 [Xylogone sp. PMI_703]
MLGIPEGIKQDSVEDYRSGYPRFAALLSAHDSFSIFRRFSTLRTRLLLLAQDEITVLEDQLNKIDQEESSPLFLACSRKDRNPNREVIISQIKKSLSAYDELVERTRRMYSYENPNPRIVESLRNWLSGNACIARNETAFLECGEDLVTLSPLEDGAVSWLGENLPDSIVRLVKSSQSSTSRDRRVHVFPRSLTTYVARMILTPLIIFFLLAPIIICNAITNSTARLATMVIATTVFVMLVSLLTKAKTIDLAVAGATYSAILVVFISGSNVLPDQA